MLDLRADRYVASPAAAFLNVLAAEGPSDPLVIPLRERLMSQGLLVAETTQVVGHSDGPAAVLTACLWAELYLRRRRLDLALRWFRGRRDGGASTASERALDQFRAWRPWYPRRNVCLFDTLAMGAFLVRAGERPEIVFGVRHPPFAAHCWLEAEGRILNDEAEYCAAFVEILRV
ncbi:MAG: lasso peptide biosynthesis B2 protein [Terricaulis sp.]